MPKLADKNRAGRSAGGHYLIFGSGCSVCTEIACSIEQETEGLLTARSLRDPEIQECRRRFVTVDAGRRHFWKSMGRTSSCSRGPQ